MGENPFLPERKPEDQPANPIEPGTEADGAKPDAAAKAPEAPAFDSAFPAPVEPAAANLPAPIFEPAPEVPSPTAPEPEGFATQRTDIQRTGTQRTAGICPAGTGLRSTATPWAAAGICPARLHPRVLRRRPEEQNRRRPAGHLPRQLGHPQLLPRVHRQSRGPIAHHRAVGGLLELRLRNLGLVEGILILVGSENFRTDARGVPLIE